MTWLFDIAIRSTFVTAAGLLLYVACRRQSAALRHRVLAATLFTVPLVAAAGLVLPAWDIHVPAEIPISVAPQAVELRSTSAPAADQPQQRAAAPPPAAQEHRRETWMLVVWLCGLLVTASRPVAGLVQLSRVARRAARIEAGPLARIAASVAAEYGLSRPVTLLQSPEPDLLATWGAWRPRVILPSHACEWSDDRLYAVLCHELAHVRRQDWLVQLASEAVRIACWFNPLAWLACRALRRESERACDDEVLARGVPPRTYAGHLLALARRCRDLSPAWAVPMARRSTLERRVAAMLDPHLDRRPLSRYAAALTVVAVMSLALPVAVIRAQSSPAPLEGVVYDPTGAVLPGVALSLRDGQGLSFEVTTDGAGYFTFPTVAPGTYELEAKLPGFRPLKQQLTLEGAGDWNRAITLQVGDVRETIRVRESRLTGATPATPSGPAPTRVGGNLRPPLKLVDVKPVYPPAMRAAGREGIVPLEAIISRDGSVTSVRVLTAEVHPDFAIAAADAVRQWRFDPTLLNGVPVEVVMNVSIEFSLSE